MTPSSADSATSRGIVSLTSPYSFADTVERLLIAFAKNGIKVFAIIDQQAEALAAGLSMPPTTLIIFGNPKAGTALMLANPQAGIDLPLKVLVCEPTPGHVLAVFLSAAEIIQRHLLAPELASNLVPAERLIARTLDQ
jgi:uncharacterized protein (DUF302 family)